MQVGKSFRSVFSFFQDQFCFACLQFTVSVRWWTIKVLIFVLDFFVLLEFILSLVTLFFPIKVLTLIDVMALPCLFSPVWYIFSFFILFVLYPWLITSMKKISHLHDIGLSYNFLLWTVSLSHLGAGAPSTPSAMSGQCSSVSQGFFFHVHSHHHSSTNRSTGATVGFFWGVIYCD